jgi:hypothetical protein
MEGLSMDLDEKLEGLGESMANKTSYQFVQREQHMARSRNMPRFIPAIAILVTILLPTIALTTTHLREKLGNSPAVDKFLQGDSNSSPGGYPYVFNGITQAGTYGAPPVDITVNTLFYVTTASVDSNEYAQASPPRNPAPATIAIYKIIRPVVNDSYASALAKQLGFNGEPLPVLQAGEKRDVYTYVNGDQILELFLNGYINLYNNKNFTEKPHYLPSDEECIAIATKWVKEHGLYPDNLVSITTSPVGGVKEIDSTTGLITNSYITGTEVTFNVAINGMTIYGGGVSVVIGDNGTLLRMQTNKFTFEQAFEVPLKDVNRAIEILTDRLTNPNTPNPNNLECIVNHRALSSLVITGIELNYAYGAYNDYILPIYVFTGDGYDKQDSDTIYQFIGQVDAVLH